MENLIFRDNPFVLVAIVLVSLALAIELPYRYGKRFVGEVRTKDETWNTIYAALLLLIAFMLGLSYAQAQGRFDARRALVVAEANAIGKTWLRADQLPHTESSRFRAILTRYAQTRVDAYEEPSNLATFKQTVAQSETDQMELWRIASDALRSHPGDLGLSLLMQAVNDTIDLSTEQGTALTQHIPTSVVVLTLVLVLMGAAATGFSFARAQVRPAVFSAIYVIALTLVLQMVIDFDRPQSGFITVPLNALRAQITAMQHT